MAAFRVPPPPPDNPPRVFANRALRPPLICDICQGPTNSNMPLNIPRDYSCVYIRTVQYEPPTTRNGVRVHGYMSRYNYWAIQHLECRARLVEAEGMRNLGA